MRKRKEQPKLVVEIESDRKTGRIKTVSVFDNRTQKYCNENVECCISGELPVEDLKAMVDSIYH